MNRIFVVLIFFSFSHLFAHDLVPYFDGEKWGYKNLEGVLVIKAEFDSVSLFDSKTRTAIVQKQEYFGLIDRSGQIVVPIDYARIQLTSSASIVLASRDSGKTEPVRLTDVFNLVNGKSFTLSSDEVVYSAPNILYKENNLWGMYDENGVQLCEQKYDQIISAKLRQSGLYIASIYKDSTHHTLGTFKYKQNVNLNYMGKEVYFPSGYISYGLYVDDHYILATVVNESGVDREALFMIEKDGSFHEQFVFDEVYNNKHLFEMMQLFEVSDGNKRYVVDSNGKRIINETNTFIQAVQFNDENFILAKDSIKWKLLDVNGKNVLKNEYEIPSNISSLFYLSDHGVFVKNKKDELCLLEFHNSEPIEKYNYGLYDIIGLNPKQEHILVRSKKNKIGVLDVSGKTIVPNKYEDIKALVGYGYKLRKKDAFQICNLEGDFFCRGKKMRIQEDQISYSQQYRSGILQIRNNNKWGGINSLGEIIIPFQYDSPFYFHRDGISITKKDGKFGLIDSLGKVLVEPKFDFIDGDSRTYYAKNGSKFGLFSSNFKQIDLKYDSIYFHNSQYIFLFKNGASFLCVKNGVVKKLPEHEEIGSTMKNDLVVLKNNNHFFLYSYFTGELVGPELYQEIVPLKNGHLKLKQNDKFGIADSTGKMVMPIEYNNIVEIDNVYAVYKNDFLGYYDTRGNRYF